ncbi:MAG TPA: glycosyltransferase [Thermoanaerobaculia bacterium]|nr:glycosyltransferase [Thermoanaerobaculia bacterium]
MDGPLYSVVIPTFNRAGVLPEAIDSVFLQGIDEVQVIVVDDGSTDATPEAVAGCIRRHGERIVYIHQENQGAGIARNRGIEVAEGRLVSLLDSDDLWLPGKMAAELELLERYPEAEAVVSDGEVWRAGSLEMPSVFGWSGLQVAAERAPFFGPEDPPFWAEKTLVPTCCITIRREALAKLGPWPFDPSLPYGEDWEMEVRMYFNCRVAVCPRILAKLRRYDDGTRGARGMPGGRGPRSERRVWDRARYEVMTRLERRCPLSPEARRAVEATRVRAALHLAGRARGWERLESLPLALGELRRANPAGALSVLAAGLRP